MDRGQRPGYHPEFTLFIRMGWQSFASTKMEEVFFGTTRSPRLDPTDRADAACTERSNGKHPIPHTTRLCRIPFRSSVFHGASSASPLVPAPLEFRDLPVWPTTGIRWRVGQHGSAGKQEHGCPSTSVSKTWTCLQGQEQTTVVWKWSLTVCFSFTAHSWPWTPWSAPSELTEHPRSSVQNEMEPPWTKPVIF